MTRAEYKVTQDYKGLQPEGMRTLWFPGAGAPPHLDGTMAGDVGFDPLGLGQDPDKLRWYQEAELFNGRWAMAGVAGIAGAELYGAGPWYEVGARDDFDIPWPALIAIQAPIMGFLETKRLQGYFATGGSGLLDSYPWDPVKLADDSMKLKEVKNGRLAMVAFFGCVVQAVVTHDSAIGNLAAHLSGPFEENIFTSVYNIPDTLGAPLVTNPGVAPAPAEPAPAEGEAAPA